jgi:predicted nucleic acid-binding protein
MTKKLYILDACALIALLKAESGADKVLAIYEEAYKGNAIIIINKINLFEVYYGFYRDDGKEYAETVMNRIIESPVIEIVETTYDVFKEAGRIKASKKHKVSLADSFVLAQAIVTGGLLATADHHEFDVIETSEEEEITFYWIR